MSDSHSGIYVEQTGHVLSAFSSAGNPKGEFTDDQKTDLLAPGVRVRLLTPPRTPVLAAHVDEVFVFDVPVEVFEDKLGTPLEYTQTGKPTWLSFNAKKTFFSGKPLTANVGSSTIKVTAKNANDDTAFENFTVVVTTRTAVAISEAFTIPDTELSLFTGEVSSDFVRSPRRYQFIASDKAFAPLPDPRDLTSLSAQLESDELVVSLTNGQPAETNIPIWALLRRDSDGVEQINASTIPKGKTTGSIAFTIDGLASYQALLLVSGYDPLSGPMKVNGAKIVWPQPTP